LFFLMRISDHCQIAERPVNSFEKMVEACLIDEITVVEQAGGHNIGVSVTYEHD